VGLRLYTSLYVCVCEVGYVEGVRCPSCGSDHIAMHGYFISSVRGRRRRYKCLDCGRTFLSQSEGSEARRRGVEGLRCPSCSSTYIVRLGYVVSLSRGRRQRYKCMDCGRTFTPSGGDT